MNERRPSTVHGNAGPGVAENMMSGPVVVKGDASQYAGRTGCGGLLVIDGNASARCGISMKGIDIVVQGSVGHMSAFMAQSGIWSCSAMPAMRWGIRSTRRALRARRGQEPRRRLHREGHARGARTSARRAARAAGSTRRRRQEFRRYGSARQLYNFHIDNLRRPTGTAHGALSTLHAAAQVGDLRRHTRSRNPPRGGHRHLRHPRRRAPSARCRTSTTCLFLGASISRYPLEGYREKCGTDVLGTRFAKKPIELKIPITIAGMSFGSLSAQRQGGARARRDRSPAPRPPPATAA